MRKFGSNGIPETSEFIPELDQLFCALCDRPKSRLLPGERAIYDIYRVMGAVECNGLTWFWAAITTPAPVFRSFETAGASNVAEIIRESRWVAAVLKRGTTTSGHYQFNPHEDTALSEIEERLYESFIGLPTKLLAYAKQQKLL